MISKQGWVVSDTSPLSAMAKMGWLPWLQERWGKVVVPGEVWRELSEIGDPEALAALDAAHSEGWLEVTMLGRRNQRLWRRGIRVGEFLQCKIRRADGASCVDACRRARASEGVERVGVADISRHEGGQAEV